MPRQTCCDGPLAGMIPVGWAKTASPDGGPAQTHRLADRAAQSATDFVKRAQAHRRSGLLGPPHKFMNNPGYGLAFAFS